MRLRWAIVAAILAIALLVQLPAILNADLGCLLTEGEKVLDGAKLGVDVFELNPPLSVYLYMPALMLARLTGMAPEIIVIVLIMIEIVVALLMIDRAAAAAELGAGERIVATCLLAFLFAILPSGVFGQREHIAVIALTPFVAVTAIRWRGLAPGPVAVLAGLGAGLAMSIKPHLALVVGLPVLLAVFRQRSPRPLFSPEVLTAAAIVIGYGAILAIVFPDYLLTYAPMVTAAYLPLRMSLGDLLPFPVIVLAASIALLRLLAPRDFKLGGDATPWLAAAVGGAASFVLQGKHWTYTAFALCMFAVAAPLLLARTKTLRLPGMIGALAFIMFVVSCLSIEVRPFPALDERVEALAPHPRLITIGDHVALGHPLVRRINGTWVGHSCVQVLAAGATLLQKNPQLAQRERAKLDGIIDFERRHLLADLRDGRPDVILVDTVLLNAMPFDWLAWAKSDPELQAELSRYREVEDVGRVRIFVDQSKSRAAMAPSLVR
ncbi:hypothetical protein ACFQZO_30135 [Bradyrhizobium sp. GCM10027634]|uniref:hypothetical protein n=1 Tax=unclassified Bradyrhizobium TaxID=2631580 RepID=UPI00188D2EF7|nr:MULTISPECIES: hypothetical protein [unclassified Bradyrhizobium]MDN5005118.1 hypothetical protein [Bradyrhizobium sp. WYCCWR 12677]QOZ48945.1 hypothetical protein XH89_26830 [Bradyrhizobium sp. CCBAU 53340]